jgi:hypothetical protein
MVPFAVVNLVHSSHMSHEGVVVLVRAFAHVAPDRLVRVRVHRLHVPLRVRPPVKRFEANETLKLLVLLSGNGGADVQRVEMAEEADDTT